MSEEKDEKKEKTSDEKKEMYANYILSLGDKELREVAEKFASFLSQFEFLQHEAVERGWGLFAAWIEQQGKKVSNPYLRAGVEKLSDVFDRTANILFGKKGKLELDKKAEKKIQDWMNRFIESAIQRLQKCENPEEYESLSQKLESEHNALRKIIDLVEGGKKEVKPIESPIEPKSFISPEMKAGIEKANDWLKKRNKKTRKEIEALKRRQENGWYS